MDCRCYEGYGCDLRKESYLGVAYCDTERGAIEILKKYKDRCGNEKISEYELKNAITIATCNNDCLVNLLSDSITHANNGIIKIKTIRETMISLLSEQTAKELSQKIL